MASEPLGVRVLFFGFSFFEVCLVFCVGIGGMVHFHTSELGSHLVVILSFPLRTPKLRRKGITSLHGL